MQYSRIRTYNFAFARVAELVDARDSKSRVARRESSSLSPGTISTLNKLNSSLVSMQHKELIDHIQGSILKKQYLEAFLVQSAYIEGLLKISVDYNFFKATYKDSRNSTDTDDIAANNDIVSAVRDKLSNLTLNDLISFLDKSKLISSDQKKGCMLIE